MKQNPILGHYLTTTPLIYPSSDHATGFFYRQEGTTYLVTNRHAVDFETENARKLKSAKIRVRTDPEDLEQFEEFELSLIDEQGDPNWLGDGPRVDIALIPLSPPVLDRKLDIMPPETVLEKGRYDYGSLAFEKRYFPENNPHALTITGGSAAIILGYPLEFFGPAFPVARNAIISSTYGRTIEGLTGSTGGIPKKSFLTDAIGHVGLSGSPVISKPPDKIGQNPNVPEDVFKAATLMRYDSGMTLLGVHAGEFDQQSQLQLNNAVYPTALTDILGKGKSQDTLDEFR